MATQKVVPSEDGDMGYIMHGCTQQSRISRGCKLETNTAFYCEEEEEEKTTTVALAIYNEMWKKTSGIIPVSQISAMSEL